MTDDSPDSENSNRRERLLLKTIPGWALMGVVIFIVLTRDNVSETLVGTLLGFSAILLGVPFVLPGKRP